MRPRRRRDRRLSDSGACRPSPARSTLRHADPLGAVPQRRPAARGRGPGGRHRPVRRADRRGPAPRGSPGPPRGRQRAARRPVLPRAGLHDVAGGHGAVRHGRPPSTPAARRRSRRPTTTSPVATVAATSTCAGSPPRACGSTARSPTAADAALRVRTVADDALDNADAVYNSICADIDAPHRTRGHRRAAEPSRYGRCGSPTPSQPISTSPRRASPRIVWAIGYRPDYRWIEASAFDGAGRPMQNRGVTDVAGPVLHRPALDAHLGIRPVPRHRRDASHVAAAIIENSSNASATRAHGHACQLITSCPPAWTSPCSASGAAHPSAVPQAPAPAPTVTW